MVRRVIAGGAMAIVMLSLAAAETRAQTDFYNIDRNRPVRIEDAYPTERHAIELKLAPIRIERDAVGVYTWNVEPGLTYGLLPRTDVEIGFPISKIDLGNESAGLGGIELSAFHNVVVETRTLPALGVRAEVTLPVGTHAPDRVRPALTAVATRSFPGWRAHLNGRYTFGSSMTSEAAETPAGEHNSRWLAGVAVDRAFVLRSLLLIVDIYAVEPLHGDRDLLWNAGGGFRYQLGPRTILDAGVGRRMTGFTGWYGTLGTAFHFAIPALIPR